MSIDHNNEEKKYKKATIPKALREQVWKTHVGEKYKHKCNIVWCKNTMTVFDFHVGHVTAEKNGGKTVLENLEPICSRCNLSMSTKSIVEWNLLGKEKISYLSKIANKLKYICRIIIS